MRCGAKCFIVQYELNGERKTQVLTSRTPAEARKALRVQTDGKAVNVTLRQQK